MRVDTHAAVLAACRHLITPLARLLLRYGIGYREFSEVCKTAFVDVATKDHGIRGRPANLSKVAVITGLSRKETKKVRERLESENDLQSSQGLNPASTVLRGWYSNPQFLSPSGTPSALSIDGRSPNLTELVRRYAGDLPVRAVILQMERIGLVERTKTGRFRPVGNSFMPPNVNGQLFASGATSIHNLISTIAHNTSPATQSTPRFERYAWSNYLPQDMSEEFGKLVAEKGQAFLEHFDAWLKKNEKATGGAGFKSSESEIGVGVYFFDVPKR